MIVPARGPEYAHLTLPALLGTRERVTSLFARQLRGDLRAKTLVLLAASLRSGSETAADEIVARALEGSAVAILPAGCPSSFHAHLIRASTLHGHPDLVLDPDSETRELTERFERFLASPAGRDALTRVNATAAEVSLTMPHVSLERALRPGGPRVLAVPREGRFDLLARA